MISSAYCNIPAVACWHFCWHFCLCVHIFRQLTFWYNTSQNGLLHKVWEVWAVPTSSASQVSCNFSLIHYWSSHFMVLSHFLRHRMPFFQTCSFEIWAANLGLIHFHLHCSFTRSSCYPFFNSLLAVRQPEGSTIWHPSWVLNIHLHDVFSWGKSRAKGLLLPFAQIYFHLLTEKLLFIPCICTQNFSSFE